MAEIKKDILEIYTEPTPNPETMKFVLKKVLLHDSSAYFPDEESAKQSPLASELFGFPFVDGVFIANNFITITKQKDHEWNDIVPTLKEFIKGHIISGKKIISTDINSDRKSQNGNNEEIAKKIKELLDTHVKPAVERDGGAIQFKSYKDGKVSLVLQGACSGCPSAAFTLRDGVERMLKHFIPEVKEVVAVGD